MKFSYGFNPHKEYGVEIAPSMENYNTSLPKREEYPNKAIRYDFGFWELFTLVMIIPFWIFVYKFFYLLVLPLVPVSVVVFELIREVAPLNKLFMFGGSFLAAYIFYRGSRWLMRFFSWSWVLFVLIFLYAFGIWSVYLLLDYYPHNKTLVETMFEINNLISLLHPNSLKHCINWV